MNYGRILGLAWAVLLGLSLCAPAASAQPAEDAEADLAEPEVFAPTPGGPRQFAPGVLTTIPPNRSAKDAVEAPVDGSDDPFQQPKDIVELTIGYPEGDWTPSVDYPGSSTVRQMATNIIPFRGVWQLEFTFKPLRVMEVDIPQPDGTAKRQVVYYLVYNVRNTGKHISPVQQDTGFFTLEEVDREGDLRGAIGPIRFIPKFTLFSHQSKKSHPDQLIPVAIPLINAKEAAGRRLLNTTEISRHPIPLSEDGVDREVWGVATWTGIDPTTDHLSIYIQGLTNAYRSHTPEGAYKQGDPPGTGRQYEYKTLKLNFYKPGDEFRTAEDTIHFGIPGEVDYEWLYMQ